ncbi:MAG: hypothetical protein ACKOGC_01485 [Anaerolineae bacterium]|jgi:hypothetical protein
MWKHGLITILTAALLIGCKGSSQEIYYTPPALAEEWTVNMTQSGGIMGMMRSIEVASDGNYVTTDERAHTSVTGKLTEQELSQFEGLVSSFNFTPPEISAVCADCFVYDIEIQSGGQKMILKTEDISLPDSGIEPFVDFLRRIMDEALN